MTKIEAENDIDTDSSDNEEQYSNLLNSVSQLDSTQRVKPASRKEVSTEVSEYNLNSGDLEKTIVRVKELAEVLNKKPKHVKLTNKLKKVTSQSQTLPKPLEKIEEDKLNRIIGYENVKKQVDRWSAIVERNSLKDHLSFPLNDNSMKLQSSSEFLKQFRTSTPLEMEIEKVLHPSEKANDEKESEEFPCTLEEMIEKRKEMAQLRAKLSYKQAKSQRQNKIKSKKYHRVLKHEKIKQQLKEFELLQKTDPTKALEKLAELDKNRALERASLRHRNTGQWAKSMTVRAKYDVETRKILADQLKVSREIAQKVQATCSSDEEESHNIEQEPKKKGLIASKDNPWSLDISKEVKDFVSGYKSYWSEKNENNDQTDKSNINQNGVDNKQDNLPSGKAESKLKMNYNHDTEISKSSSISINEMTCDKKQNSRSKSKKKNEKLSKSQKGVTKNESTSEKNSNQLQVISFRPTSGMWMITSVSDEQDNSPKAKKKRHPENINTLFGELEENIKDKVNKKLKIMTKKLNDYNKMKASENEDVKKLMPKEEKQIDSSLKSFNTVQRPDLDEKLFENGNEESMCEDVLDTPIKVNDYKINEPDAEIDPKNFIRLKAKKLHTHIPDNVAGGDDAIDDEAKQQQTIEEAFAGDDVVEEFRKKKKKNEEEDDTELKIPTALPGWGQWGGKGIVPSRRKKKSFMVVKLPPRKDKKKSDIIINENENPNIKQHLVKAVPHPFKTPEAFESTMRAPIGREWVPETAHQKLIQSSIETKLGTIIEPMTENEIIKVKKTQKCPYKGKTKGKKN